MSCGRIALERAGIKVDNYFASEIDKYAIHIAGENYPDNIQLGPVENYKGWALPKIDLVIGGSPCQGFSVAGSRLKRKNFDDPRSALFWYYVACLEHFDPYFFLLENVFMKKEWLNAITIQMGVNPTAINSSLVSGQNRSRMYWSDIPDIKQPQDKGVLFQDVLESDEARMYKAFALTATYYKKGSEETRQRQFKRSQRPIAWITDDTTRWLTPLECERLQTVPDGYTEGVSNTQRYKMLGNGWTVDVIAHIFKNLYLLYG